MIPTYSNHNFYIFNVSQSGNIAGIDNNNYLWINDVQIPTNFTSPPFKIAIDSLKNVYILNDDQTRIWKFDGTRLFILTSIPGDDIGDTFTSIFIDSNDVIYTHLRNLRQIYSWDASGQQYPDKLTYEVDTFAFVIDSNGNFIFSDSDPRHGYLKYSSGEVIATIYDQILQMFIDSSDILYYRFPDDPTVYTFDLKNKTSGVFVLDNPQDNFCVSGKYVYELTATSVLSNKEECPTGTFSSPYSTVCNACTDPGENQYIITPCTPTSDNIFGLLSEIRPSPSGIFTVSGFYGPSSNSNVLSVYLTQGGMPIKKGMTITGLVGINGKVTVTDFASNVYGDVVVNPGPPSISFPYVDVVSAQVSGGNISVSPSSVLQLTFSPPKKNKYNAFRGPLTTDNNFTVYIVDDISGDEMNIKNWDVAGFSNFDLTGNVKATSAITFAPGISNVMVSTKIVLANYYYTFTAQTDQLQVLPTPSSVVQITVKEPIEIATLTTANYGLYDPKLFDDTEIKGQPAELRDLNSNVSVVPVPKEAYIEMIGRGFGSGALTALAAIGAQEKYMYGGESNWIPHIKQHTPFAITQRMLLPLVTGGGQFLDSTKTFSVNIYPRESGDLLANMYLSVSLPALPTGYNYTPLVGRAILKQVEFLIDGNPIETLTDDWYIIRDQLFLDADEKLAMYQAVSLGQAESNVVPATSPVQMMIPLDFFFCRRHTHGKKGREKLEKPFFPLCAILQQTVTIRFTFCNPAWITKAPKDINGKTIDLIKPRVLIEEITLSPQERLYYQRKTMSFNINHAWSEAGHPYSGGKAVMNLTANFPVSMITWFVRNQLFESQNSAYYASRYNYGYTTDFTAAAVPVTFFNGVTTNFLDIIQSATIYLNNENILSNFPGALYYSYKQPLDHGLSVPTKNLYMYCFGDTPREYNQEGLIDFSTMVSNTTHLDLNFNTELAPQIQQAYTMNLYYYGYVKLNISDGYAKLG